MSLIQCLNCGHSISEEATICPHCNHPNAGVSTDNVVCPECGTQYTNEQNFCPNCGCPANINNAPKKKKHKAIIITAIILFIALISGLSCSFIVNNEKKKAQAEKEAEAKKEAKKELEAYYYNLEKITYKMIDGGAKAESSGNLTKNVWSNAIWQKQDDETDKYTMENGEFVDDFNDALANLFADENFAASIDEIKNNQSEVLKLMKKLRNPPKEYEEAYSVLKDLYDNYSKLMSIVITPTGSFNTFSEDFNTYDNALADSYGKMILYFD